jgi:hypothetical protein
MIPQQQKKPIIELGGKGRPARGKENSAAGKLSSILSDAPSPLGRSIFIRYIDPRMVPLLTELGKLSLMVQKLADSCAQGDRKDLEELAKSTKDLSLQMESIMEDSSPKAPVEGVEAPEKVESELTYQPRSSQRLLSESQLEGFDMVEVLNRVSLRMDELQDENSQLRTALQQEQQRSGRLEGRNEQLEQQLRRAAEERAEEGAVVGCKIREEGLQSNRQPLRETMAGVRSYLSAGQ